MNIRLYLLSSTNIMDTKAVQVDNMSIEMEIEEEEKTKNLLVEQYKRIQEEAANRAETNKECRRCGLLKKFAGDFPCYGTKQCNHQRGECGNCLNPNHDWKL